jgi:hypothetical protein
MLELRSLRRAFVAAAFVASGCDTAWPAHEMNIVEAGADGGVADATSASDAGGSSDGAVPADAAASPYLLGCDTLFAARVLEMQLELDASFMEDCDAPLADDVGFLNDARDPLCRAGESANECRTRIYETPPDMRDLNPGCWDASRPRGCMRGKWVPRCADGTDGCAEAEAVCQDGTRPMIYAERARTGEASNEWIFLLGGEGGPCHGELCWFTYRYARELGETVRENAMTSVHPDHPGDASQTGDGIMSGAPAGGANPFASYNRVRANRCSDWISDAAEVVTYGDGAPADFAGRGGVPEATRFSTTTVHHRGFDTWRATFRSLATDAGRDLDGDGTADLPSLADATTIVLAGASDSSHWLAFAADRLADELRAIAGADVVVRVLLDAYFEPGLDSEGRFHDIAPADFDLFTHPYSSTGLCELPDNGDGVDNEACSNASYRPGVGVTTYRDGVAARGSLLDESCEDRHGPGAPECYDKIHTLVHHVSTPFMVLADQEDPSISDAGPLYAEDPSYAWADPETYRERVLAQAYDIEASWGTTAREDGAGIPGAAFLVLPKTRRGSEPWGRATHVHVGSNPVMQSAMTLCSAAGAPIASASLGVIVDTWARGSATQMLVVEDGASWDGTTPYWVTGSSCIAPE